MSDDRLSALCDHIKEQALSPAKKEAEEILENAREEAKKILDDAKRRSDLILDSAKLRYQSILEKAGVESRAVASVVISKIKDEIENKLFKKSFFDHIKNSYDNYDFLFPIVESIVNSLNSNGLSKAGSIILSDSKSIDDITKKIAFSSFYNIDGGIVLSIGDIKESKNHFYIDVTVDAIADIFWPLIRGSIRKSVFDI